MQYAPNVWRRQVIDYVRLVWGAVLLWQPAAAVRATGGPATATGTTVARTLGARHVAQAILLIAVERNPLLRPPPARRIVRRLAAGADALHALSAVVLALAGVASRAWAADTAVATTFAAATWHSADVERAEHVR